MKITGPNAGAKEAVALLKIFVTLLVFKVVRPYVYKGSDCSMVQNKNHGTQ